MRNVPLGATKPYRAKIPRLCRSLLISLQIVDLSGEDKVIQLISFKPHKWTQHSTVPTAATCMTKTPMEKYTSRLLSAQRHQEGSCQHLLAGPRFLLSTVIMLAA